MKPQGAQLSRGRFWKSWVVLGILALALSAPAPTLQAQPQASTRAVALLATKPGDASEVTELYFAQPGQLGAPVATLHHRGGTVRAVVWSDGVVMANAPEHPAGADGNDRSFDGALYRLEAGAQPVRLAGRCLHASRPVVTDGGLYVARGRAGTPGDTYRIDTLTIDAIDPAVGSATTLVHWRGYHLHLAAAHAGELIVYRVGPRGAELIAVDEASGTPRLLLSVPAFARDFSLTDSTLAFRGRRDNSWTVETLDVANGRHAIVARNVGFAAAPHAWSDADVAYNPHRRGLHLLAGGQVAPFGAVGVDWIRAVEHPLVAGLHTEQNKPAVPFVLDRDTHQASRLPFPVGARVEIAGFVGAP